MTSPSTTIRRTSRTNGFTDEIDFDSAVDEIAAWLRRVDPKFDRAETRKHVVTVLKRQRVINSDANIYECR